MQHRYIVLAHYLMIDQLSATADYCQQTALEGSEPSLMIVHLSQRWDATLRIMTNLSSSAVYSSRFPVSFPLTVSSNGADNGHNGSVAVHRDRILISLKKWVVP